MQYASILPKESLSICVSLLFLQALKQLKKNQLDDAFVVSKGKKTIEMSRKLATAKFCGPCLQLLAFSGTPSHPTARKGNKLNLKLLNLPVRHVTPLPPQSSDDIG